MPVCIFIKRYFSYFLHNFKDILQIWDGIKLDHRQIVWRSEKSLFCNRWRWFLVFGQGSEISTSELRRSFVGFGCDNSHGATLSGDNNSCSYYLSPGERSQAPLTIQALMIWDLLWVHIGFSSHKWPITSNGYHLPLGHKVWPLTSNRYPLCFLGDCPIGVRLLLFGICIWGPTLYEQIIHFSLLDYPKFRKRFFQISKKKLSNQRQQFEGIQSESKWKN